MSTGVRVATGVPLTQVRAEVGAILREIPEIRPEAIEELSLPRPVQAAASVHSG